VPNFSYLGKLEHAELGGHIVTIASAHKALAALAATDDEIIERFFTHLTRMFPRAADIVDPRGAVVQRWAPEGLPWMRPGSFATRGALRQDIGNVLLCGDYTSEPGLAGANHSGFHVGQRLAHELETVSSAVS
jgi:hypothetical protein